MKTMAIRLDDEVAEMLEMVALLEDTAQIDQIREAIMLHLQHKVANPALTQRAQSCPRGHRPGGSSSKEGDLSAT